MEGLTFKKNDSDCRHRIYSLDYFITSVLENCQTAHWEKRSEVLYETKTYFFLILAYSSSKMRSSVILVSYISSFSYFFLMKKILIIVK